jgi:hypothetical protein
VVPEFPPAVVTVGAIGTEMTSLSTGPQAQRLAAHAAAIEHDDPCESIRRMEFGWFEILSLMVIDAVIGQDLAALDQVEDLLSRAHRCAVLCGAALEQGTTGRTDLPAVRRAEGRLEMMMEFLRSARHRIAPVAIATRIAGTHGERFLRVVLEHPLCNSRTISEELAQMNSRTDGSTRPVDAGQLSRIGTKLRAENLVFSVRGRGGLAWDLTPRGRHVLDVLSVATGSTTVESPTATVSDGPQVVPDVRSST